LQPIGSADVDIYPIRAMSAAETWLRDIKLPLAFGAKSRIERRLCDLVGDRFRSSGAIIAWSKINLTREELALDMAKPMSCALQFCLKILNFGL
jgi:hypothetical protein